MKKQWIAAALTALILTLTATGCKIERPAPPTGSTGSYAASTTVREEGGTSVSPAPQGGTAGAGSTNAQSGTKPAAKGTTGRNKTDSVPHGKPAPQEPQTQVVDKEKTLTCTLTISCATILNNMDKLKPNKVSVLPQNGVIFSTQKVTFRAGESVFDVLVRETKARGIHFDFENVPAFNTKYIKGIGNIYERDCGEASGWQYSVNGWFPGYGVSRYTLKEGDDLRLLYTCDNGGDIGNGGSS